MPQALDEITDARVIAESNEDRRQDLQPAAPLHTSDSSDDSFIHFLPVGKAALANQLLQDLLIHPNVNVHNGMLFVEGRNVGHLVNTLHQLFGD